MDRFPLFGKGFVFFSIFWVIEIHSKLISAAEGYFREAGDKKQGEIVEGCLVWWHWAGGW